MADAFLMSRLFVCFFVVVWHATRFQILPAGPPSPVIVSHDVKHESVAGLDFAENNNNNNNNNQKNPNGMSVDRLDDTWRPITWPARLTCWSDPEVVFLSTLSGRVTSAVLSLSFLCFFFHHHLLLLLLPIDQPASIGGNRSLPASLSTDGASASELSSGSGRMHPAWCVKDYRDAIERNGIERSARKKKTAEWEKKNLH